jgi:hypothetical protein
MPRGVATLDELAARIEALFRRYGAHDPRLAALDDETLDQFRVEELGGLVKTWRPRD